MYSYLPKLPPDCSLIDCVLSVWLQLSDVTKDKASVDEILKETNHKVVYACVRE